jgi:hypothetical protein
VPSTVQKNEVISLNKNVFSQEIPYLFFHERYTATSSVADSDPGSIVFLLQDPE